MQINAIEYLYNTAARLPEKTAFKTGERSLTFGGLLELSERIGSALLSHTRNSDPVVVISEKDVMTVALFMGVLQAGCLYAPIDKELPAARIQTILSVIEAKVMLCDKQSEEFVGTLGFEGTILTVDEKYSAATDSAGLATRRANSIDADPAYIIFTSGSTGTPKGVLGTHRALIDYIDAITEVTCVDENDVLGNQSPLDYIAGIRDIYIPLKTGASTLLIPKSQFVQPAALFNLLTEQGVNTIFWVASALSACVELNVFSQSVPETLQKIIFTGSVMPCRHLRVWQDHLPGRFFMNQYGPTEITASCTYYIVPGKVEPDDVLPIGVPFRNTEILLIDDEDSGVTLPGKCGEIYVRGSCVSPGYYRDPERTGESFVRNPLNVAYDEIIYRTGDIGEWDENGILLYRGRRDNQVKHMGHRIELGEIEAAVSQLGGVGDSVCLYREDRKTLYLFYTGDAEPRVISAFLRGSLPTFMIPRKYVKLAALPLLHNGKFDRNELKKMMLDEKACQL